MESATVEDGIGYEETGAARLRTGALEALDFHTVRRAVAERASFPPARQLALELSPSYGADEVEALQRETAEARALLDVVDLSLYSSADPSAAVVRASLDGVLTGKELVEVAESLEVQRNARSTVLRNRARAPLLALICEGIPELDELQRQVRDSIGQRGDVLDAASPALRPLRRQLRAAYEKVTDSLTGIMQSAVGREALQDQVISIRGERLVLQVKAGMRQRIPGVVLDASNTGATLFVEPFGTVELCNEWRELALEEQREVRRVLRDLSALVGSLAVDIRRGVELVSALDLILARARYSSEIKGVQAIPTNTGGWLRLLSARHPLLGDDATPIDVTVGPDWSVLVITGPNTGGKTVAMKTVGLLAAMNQSGLQLPVDEGSSLPVYDAIYADVGDKQSIEHSVSTFSSHMRNVIDILSEAGRSSLVLLDELGTSTDPEEGSALARAILDHLAENKITTVATTHHRSVAAYAEGHTGMTNASVRLDAESLQPTYDLTIGVPGRSYAMSVASSLGLPDEIMEKAKSLMEPRHVLFEDWLTELQDDRRRLQELTEETERTRAQAQLLRRELSAQMDYLVTHREEMLDGVRRQLVARYEEIDKKTRRLEAAASWQPAPGRLEQARTEIEEVKRELDMELARLPAPARVTRDSAIGVGDFVHVKGLNLKGQVLSVSEEEGEAEVSVGKVRLRIDLARLSLAAEEDAEKPPPAISANLGPSLDSLELDIRGFRAEEALISLEQFLDKAVRDGLSSVRIIHGKGTGALREAVREHLERHPLARSFESEPRERGGSGATAVELN